MMKPAVLVERIIREQEQIIGPLAWVEAKKVSGLTVDVKKHRVDVVGKTRDALSQLVKQYEGLFGRASREVCRDAVRSFLPEMPAQDVPDVLK